MQLFIWLGSNLCLFERGPDAEWRRLPGIIDVCCVYVGGKQIFPTYRSIGDHTEGVTIVFDPSVTTYRACLDHFFSSHSPFQSQGCTGAKRQYSFGVWYHNEKQRVEVERKVAEIEQQAGRIVLTIVEPLTRVYRAEEYHQQYYEKRRN